MRPVDLDLPPNTTFDAFVSYRDASYNWQPEGPMCNYTTGAGGLKNGDVSTSSWSDESRNESFEDLIFSVYPNPTESVFNVQWEYTKDAVVTLFDLSSRIVLKADRRPSKYNTYGVISGVYILNLTCGERVNRSRLSRDSCSANPSHNPYLWIAGIPSFIHLGSGPSFR